LRGRIGNDVVENRQRNAGFRQRIFGTARRTGVTDTFVGNQHHALCSVGGDDLGNFSGGAGLEQNVLCGLEGKRIHRVPHL
jgi:hypothetical protein